MPYSASKYTPSALSFRPATINMTWDGVSEAHAVIDIACPKTASTYAAYAYKVFSMSDTIQCGTFTFSRVKGQRIQNCQGGNLVSVSDVVLPITAAGNTVKIKISSLDPAYTYAWWLQETRATGVRTLSAGRIDTVIFDPYVKATPSVVLASASTADTGCG
jgi:hypothetical protein